MATKMYVISFTLLALFIATSMQMPEYEAKVRVRRQDSSENATATASGGGETGTGEESTGSSGTGGGLSGSGGGSIPGREIIDKWIEMFTDPTNIRDTFKPFTSFFGSGGRSAKDV